MKMTYTRVYTEEITAEVIRETWQAKIEDPWDGPAWRSEEYPTKEALLQVIKERFPSELSLIQDMLNQQPRTDRLDAAIDTYSNDFYGHRVYHRYYFE